MEWCIPIQTFQVEHVQIGMPLRGAKPIVPLAYRDGAFHFPVLSVLLPTLPVKFYDPATGRLVLSLAESAQTLHKLQTLQDSLLSAVNAHHSGWYDGPRRRPYEIRAGFQPMIQGDELHLYCPIYESMAQPIPIFMDGAFHKGKLPSGILKGGRRVRIAIRLHGISFHTFPGSTSWSGKFRIQHKIMAVLVEAP